MGANDTDSKEMPSLDKQRFDLDRERFALDRSFARKWLPAVAPISVSLIAVAFGYFQWQQSSQELKTKNDREWALKIVEMYLSKRELFDFQKDAEQAESNFKLLSMIAPQTVEKRNRPL
jgi:hypothetical protein